jgi:hypothetical protein
MGMPPVCVDFTSRPNVPISNGNVPFFYFCGIVFDMVKLLKREMKCP